MHSNHNAGGPALLQGLDDVNSKVRLVQAAWEHFSQWRDIGAHCAMSAMQLAVARSLLIEAIEEWALSLGRLLELSRQDDGLERLSETVQDSLQRAAAYLSRVAASAGSDGSLYVQFSR